MIKSYILVILTFIVSTTNLNAQQQLNSNTTWFKGSLNEAFNKAKSEDKLVYIDVYTSWCMPCKFMDKKVLNNNLIVPPYMNKNFVNVKIDYEKEEATELKKIVSVTSYPTSLVFNGNGEPIGHFTGSRDVNVFTRTIERAYNKHKTLAYLNTLKTLNKSQQLDAILCEADAVFNIKNMDNVQLQEHLTQLEDKATSYFKALSLKEKTNKNVWGLLSHPKIMNPLFLNFIIDNFDALSDTLGSQQVILNYIESTYETLAKSKPDALQRLSPGAKDMFKTPKQKSFVNTHFKKYKTLSELRKLLKNGKYDDYFVQLKNEILKTNSDKAFWQFISAMAQYVYKDSVIPNKQLKRAIDIENYIAKNTKKNIDYQGVSQILFSKLKNKHSADKAYVSDQNYDDLLLKSNLFDKVVLVFLDDNDDLSKSLNKNVFNYGSKLNMFNEYFFILKEDLNTPKGQALAKHLNITNAESSITMVYGNEIKKTFTAKDFPDNLEELNYNTVFDVKSNYSFSARKIMNIQLFLNRLEYYYN